MREAATPEELQMVLSLLEKYIFRTFVRRLTRPTLRANEVRRTL